MSSIIIQYSAACASIPDFETLHIDSLGHSRHLSRAQEVLQRVFQLQVCVNISILTSFKMKRSLNRRPSRVTIGVLHEHVQLSLRARKCTFVCLLKPNKCFFFFFVVKCFCEICMKSVYTTCSIFSCVSIILLYTLIVFFASTVSYRICCHLVDVVMQVVPVDSHTLLQTQTYHRI